MPHTFLMHDHEVVAPNVTTRHTCPGLHILFAVAAGQGKLAHGFVTVDQALPSHVAVVVPVVSHAS